MTNEERVYPATPAQVDAEKHLWGAFDNMETEISALYIVRMFQERGAWKPFTKAEIEEFYQRCGRTDGFWFNRLITDGYVVRRPDGKLEVSEDFVARVYRSSPLVEG